MSEPCPPGRKSSEPSAWRNGCPSLSIKPNPDPLRSDPVATVIDSCVGCGVCGEVAHAAVLCPSFYKARIVSNPTAWDRVRQRLRGGVIGWLQRRDARRRSRFDFPGPVLRGERELR